MGGPQRAGALSFDPFWLSRRHEAVQESTCDRTATIRKVALRGHFFALFWEGEDMGFRPQSGCGVCPSRECPTPLLGRWGYGVPPPQRLSFLPVADSATRKPPPIRFVSDSRGVQREGSADVAAVGTACASVVVLLGAGCGVESAWQEKKIINW